MAGLSPKEWSTQANKLQVDAGRPLDRQTLEQKLGKPNGKVTRGTSIEKGGKWKARTGDRVKQAKVRSSGERTYTTDAARSSAARIRRLAKEQSQSTQHQYVYGSNPSIGEHSQNIQSGGIGDDLDSVSDPDFKQFKDNVEQRVRRQYGNKYVVDINEVTGFLRVIPRSYYNKQQYRSQQPGYDVEPGMDIDRVINVLPFMVRDDLSMRQTSSPLAPEPEIKIFATPKENQQTSTPLIFPDSPPTLPTNTAEAPEQPVAPTGTTYAYSENGGATNGDKLSNTLFQVGTAALLTGGALLSNLGKLVFGGGFDIP